jgi:hypothetical protein
MELARLSPLNPFAILEVPLDATHEAVRSAFLSATKRYHPNRFALEAPETVEAANELFLLIRRAYGQLADDSKRRVLSQRLGSGTGPLAQEAQAASPNPSRAQGTQPPLAPLPEAPPRGAPKPAAPRSLTPPTVRTRTPIAGVPVKHARAYTPALGTAPPPVPAASPPVSPTTGRTHDEVRAILESAKNRPQRFEQAVALIVKRELPAAREILAKLVAEDPQAKRFRVQLLHVTALQLETTDRLDEALRELERAAALDPEADDVQRDLKRLRDKKGRGGFFSKLFGH